MLKVRKKKLYCIIFVFIFAASCVYRQSDVASSSPCPAASFVSRLKGPFEPLDEQLIQFVRKNFLTRPSEKPYGIQLNRTDLAAQEYNEYREIQLSWMFLYHEIRILYPPGTKERGFFVEAGAYDGEMNSNTLYLEWQLGWKGLLVEPDDHNFQILLSKKRRVWSCQCCLSAKPYPYKTVLAAISSSPTFASGGLFTSLLESKTAVARTNYGFPVYKPVQCLPLHTLLMALNRTHVDLISLDIEDMEMQVLKTFPMSRISVDVWLVEHVHPAVGLLELDKKDPRFIQWFESNGYLLYKVGKHSPMDYIFIKRNSSYYKKNYKRLNLTPN